MSNITDKVTQIRTAVLGKDVRESIASSIEAMNDEVSNNTIRQNAVDANENTRISNENTRISNENTRISNENYRKSTFDSMLHADPTLELVAARNGETDLGTRLNKMDTKEQSLQDGVNNINTSIININNEIGKRSLKGQNIRIVAKTNGEYSSVLDAVNAGGDTIDNPITVLVYPGTYNESVYIKQWSRINLVGTDKKNCIIRQDHGEYLNAPLETAGERYIANITFISTYFANPSLDISLRKNYAFHGDKNSGGEGKTLIENCRFESYQSASVGLGIYNNQIFHFRNCEFYSKIESYSPIADIGAFFAHNNIAGGATNGQLILENCTFFMDNTSSNYGNACHINDANLTDGDGSGNPLNVKFINCTFKKNAGDQVNAIRVDNTNSINNLSGSITLDKSSHGNNISMVNFPQLIWAYPTLPSGITNTGSSFTPLRYTKDCENLVKVEAALTGLTSGVSTKIFTLPIGFRPFYHRFYDIVNYSGSTLQLGKILVNRNGDVSVEGTLNSTRCDINFEFYAEQ